MVKFFKNGEVSTDGKDQMGGKKVQRINSLVLDTIRPLTDIDFVKSSPMAVNLAKFHTKVTRTSFFRLFYFIHI